MLQEVAPIVRRDQNLEHTVLETVILYVLWIAGLVPTINWTDSMKLAVVRNIQKEHYLVRQLFQFHEHQVTEQKRYSHSCSHYFHKEKENAEVNNRLHQD